MLACACQSAALFGPMRICTFEAGGGPNTERSSVGECREAQNRRGAVRRSRGAVSRGAAAVSERGHAEVGFDRPVLPHSGGLRSRGWRSVKSARRWVDLRRARLRPGRGSLSDRSRRWGRRGSRSRGRRIGSAYLLDSICDDGDFPSGQLLVGEPMDGGGGGRLQSSDDRVRRAVLLQPVRCLIIELLR
jgi:hypothetical protein